MTQRDDTPPDPHEDRLNRARERMSTDYDDAPPPRRASRPKWWEPGRVLPTDPTTRRLTFGAFGLGALLVLGVGGWTLFGHHQSGIPVIGPPPEPIREKPANPGGMELDGAMAPADVPGGAAHLAPGPEQPDPDALAARYGGKAKEDTGDGDGAAAPAPEGATPARQAAPAKETGPAAPQPADQSPAPPAPAPVPPVREAAIPAPAPAGKPPAARPAAEASAKPQAPVATASGPYGVQLAAVDSEASAHKEWERITSFAPDLFAGHSPLIEKVVHNNAIFYRLRMRGFDSVAAAQAFCVRIREHGHACNPLRP
ncbi:SPOR domain-containing protein [Acetobacter fallax]|uniref:Sporulation protein n=1 Tax=Acetobacter fallax TaxID=1737473 RepID=A0ABX0KBS8_9PROT|nr:SPOR domain-containing protein [Acetobacter fallax]NHO33894.1 sporulation protein [Acetobacter fallax]NHO37467.1 sporulation protein [Acetobacter fallax]